MLAKITSELGKPAGLVVLSRTQALERFRDHSPGLVPGIGPKTVARLEAMGIRTLGELGGRPRPELEDAFGPRAGAWLHRRGRLRDETPVTPEHETKSQSAETTFDVDVHRPAEPERHLGELTRELCRRLRKRELRGRTIGIKVRLDDWTNVTRSQTIDHHTNDPAVVEPVALELLRAYAPPRPVRLLGVRLASFAGEGEASASEPEPQLQLSLPS
jgi:DNA polymerase-4